MAKIEANLLQIKTLGGLAIEVDGTAVKELASSKTAALLVYLACTGRAQPREVLAELMWDERTQRQAMANLRVVLSSLRKVLGQYVSITRKTASVNADSSLALDARQLEEAAEKAREGIRSAEQAQALSDSLSLYGGDFLAGFFLPDARGFGTWASGERERLHRVVVDAFQRLGRWHLQRGEWAAAAAWATRTVEVEPLAEEGHRQLMEAMARGGQRAEALAQYETCRHLLDAELGVEPQAETRALYAAIHSDAFAVLEAPERSEEKGRSIVHNLPAQSTPFYGRERELGALDQLLKDRHVRLVTIVGRGGIGKTRLAVAAAERQVARQSPVSIDGVYWVSLSAHDGPEQLRLAISAAVDFSPEDAGRGGRTEWRQLMDYLQERVRLLVLDNFEHLLDAVGTVGQIVQDTTGVRLLITSRERLNVRQEHIYPLDGFTIGDWHNVAAADSDPFVQLFMDRARRARPDFDLVPEEFEHLADLLEITGGLPLAVELAASWVEVLPLRQIVAEIRRDLDFLQTDLRDMPHRQRSMRAVFEASWRRLEVETQAIFARLSIFRGGFGRKAADDVARASVRNLATLSAKSLLQYDAAQDRYQIHELLRQFGEEMLSTLADMEQETRQRHAAFYCRMLQEREQAWSGVGAGDALAELEREIGNLRLAWKWAAARGEVQLMADGLDSLCSYYDRRGYEGEAGKVLRAASEALSSWSGKGKADYARGRLLVRVLTWYSSFSNSIGERLAALDKAKAVLSDLQRQKVDAREEEAFLAYWTGDARWDAGEPDVARACFKRSLFLYQELNDSAGMAVGTTAQGYLEWHFGNYEEAVVLARQALEQQKTAGNKSGVAHLLGLLGLIEKHRGNLEEAKDAHRESYALLRELGHRSGAATAAATLAFTLGFSGDFAEAHVSAGKGLELANQARSLRFSSTHRQAATWVCIHLGRYDEARQHTSRALALFRNSGDRQKLGWSLCHSGMLNLASKSHGDKEAVAQLEEAAALLKEGGIPTWMVCLVHQALALQQVGQRLQARKALADAIRGSLNGRKFFVAVHVLPVAAQFAAEEGNLARALELYALACRYRYVANSRWYEDIMGEKVAHWIEVLPADVVVAARERGQARELWATVEELLEEWSDWQTGR